MVDITATPSWDGVYRIETTDPVLGGEGPDAIANIQAQALANQNLYSRKHGGALPFSGGLAYDTGDRVKLTSGEIVKSKVDGNTSDPNSDMTNWEVADPRNVGAKPSELGQPDTTSLETNANIYLGGFGIYDPNAPTKIRPAWDAIGGTAPGASVNALKLTGHVIKEGLDSAINLGGRAGYYNYVGDKGSLSLTYGGDNYNGHLAGVIAAFHCDLLSDVNGVGSHGVVCGGSFAQIAGDYSGVFAGTRKKVYALSSVALGGSGVQIGDLSDATLVRRGATVGGLNLRMVAGYESVQVGGSGNTHTLGNRSVQVGGEGNEMAANWSTILGGKAVKVTADYSVAYGWGVVSDVPYAMASNNGYFTKAGDNQNYQIMARRVGTTASNEVFLSASGGSGVDIFSPKPNQVGFIDLNIQGFDTDTKQYWAFSIKCTFSTLSGALVLKGQKVDIIHEDVAGFVVASAITASGARVGVKITTATPINSRWNASGSITVQSL